eukprot:EC119176.1.p1 GENE.EC119176.1~~EC119176.1.p1  ORF type:complete len:124 (+),score=19.75 EC119176.1:109-480(+)
MHAAAAVLGGLAFCPHCGTLLDSPAASDECVCDRCQSTINIKDFLAEAIVTRSVPKLASRRAERSADQQRENKKSERATVDEPCPKCGNTKMAFTTAQLRSADEGQTVFYECLRCGHTFSVNT